MYVTMWFSVHRMYIFIKSIVYSSYSIMRNTMTLENFEAIFQCHNAEWSVYSQNELGSLPPPSCFMAFFSDPYFPFEIFKVFITLLLLCVGLSGSRVIIQCSSIAYILCFKIIAWDWVDRICVWEAYNCSCIMYVLWVTLLRICLVVCRGSRDRIKGNWLCYAFRCCHL